jgi:hypothetical protein
VNEKNQHFMGSHHQTCAHKLRKIEIDFHTMLERDSQKIDRLLGTSCGP